MSCLDAYWQALELLRGAEVVVAVWSSEAAAALAERTCLGWLSCRTILGPDQPVCTGYLDQLAWWIRETAEVAVRRSH